MKFSHSTLVACATVLAFAHGPVSANATETVTFKVYHDDLNIQTDAGATELEKRVSRAIRSVCRQNGRSLPEIAHENNCRRTARQDAAEQVRLAMSGKTGSGSGKAAGRAINQR
ncbi:UrcA family protein [Sphingorhabdus contaminans]|uniref:UrcA family protein n=1 Tax=Sphingorhabdus contaminans TaxID=1343899 RepID=A0A553WA99_9SPHN|nr:UrcA family protein [Sphingorhabdus contaminans]TSB01618.1 UrcA family protein [Sphingorhabdus contaminans]